MTYYEVSGHQDYLAMQAHQLDVDEQGVLRFFEYKEKDGQSVPSLTTIAAWAAGSWLYTREITEQEYKDLQGEDG
jgi:hypothetical protein